MRRRAVALIACVGIACAPAPLFPEALTFGGAQMRKASQWTRGRIAGAVYAPVGQDLSEAARQLSIVVSEQHRTAADLRAWTRDQLRQAGVPPIIEHAVNGELCYVATTSPDGARPYVALQVCRADDDRAACVDADEALDPEVFTACRAEPGCFATRCTARWARERELLERAVADALARRLTRPASAPARAAAPRPATRGSAPCRRRSTRS